MTELDPRLREFENRLKTLRPKNVTCHVSMPQKNSEPSKSRSPAFRRVIVGAVVTTIAGGMVTAVSLLLCVMFFRPDTANTVASIPIDKRVCKPVFEPTQKPAVSSSTGNYEFPTMRKQLALLLDEMTVKSSVPEKKTVYPVIELAVSHEPVLRKNFSHDTLLHKRSYIEPPYFERKQQ